MSAEIPEERLEAAQPAGQEPGAPDFSAMLAAGPGPYATSAANALASHLAARASGSAWAHLREEAGMTADTWAQESPRAALAGLQLTELASGGAGAYCGRLFALFGAEVVRIEPADGDGVRLAEPFPGDDGDPNRGAQHAFLNAGKRSVALDASGGRDTRWAERRIQESDVLLSDWRAPSWLPLAEPERIAERFPGTLYVAVSPFGMTGPYAHYRADGHVIEALAGMSYISGDPDREPLSLGVDLADYTAGVSAFTAALAALADRREGAAHGHIDVSAFESLAIDDDYSLAMYIAAGAVRRRHYSRVILSYPSDIMECADGYVTFVPRFTADPATALAALIERPELAADPLFADQRERVARWREFEALLGPWLKARSVGEVLRRSRALGIEILPAPSIADLLADEHLRGRNFFGASADGQLAVGPPVRMSATPLRVASASAPGADDDLDSAPGGRRAAGGEPEGGAPSPGGSRRMPFFQRLRVVDLSHVWVGPLATRILAELGADVIKIERPNPPETARTLFPAANDTSGEYWNRSPYFHARNASKRGMSLDLSSPAGRDVFQRLLAGADVLVENFTPRVMRAFGLDYETLRRSYPSLIMASISGYGQSGPDAGRRSSGVSMEPAAGIASVTGYAGGHPSKTGNTWVDPFVGVHVAAALIAALMHRERTGEGQYIEVSMQETTMQLLGPRFLDYAANGQLPQRTGNRRPGSIRGVYPCRGADDWAAISISGDAEWQAFCEASGHLPWALDPRFSNAAVRWAHHDEIDALIAGWTRPRTKFEVMHRLQAAGVRAGAVLKADEILASEQLAARRFFDPIEIVDFGTVPMQRSFPAKIDGRGYPVRGPAPNLDEHADEILREAGLSDAEIANLRRLGVISADKEQLLAAATRDARRQPYATYLEIGSVQLIDPQHRLKCDEALAGRPAEAEPQD